MKCASATAGIASVVTGLAVVLSSAPAHSTFLYLNQSQLISAAISASSVATSSGESPGAELHFGNEDSVAVAENAEGSEAEHANVAIVYAGTQQAAIGAYGTDAASDRAGYSAPSGFRWMTPRSAIRADGALPRYRADSNLTRPASGSPVTTSPSKDSPAGSGGVTNPAVPVTNVPSTTLPNEAGSPPVNSAPISSPPSVEPPIVGLPSKSVPEPSTVGLLGMGLLLVFIGLGRSKRARYYSKVSGSPRSSREMGSLARSLNQGSFNKA